MADEHPGPWRWVEHPANEWGPAFASLHDANGDNALCPTPDVDLVTPSPRVRVLIELAPNLERLREIERSNHTQGLYLCPACDLDEEHGHEPDCWLGNTIAALDAAR